MNDDDLRDDTEELKAPFPWFGGKSTVADIVWSRFGKVPNYVEPFFGSGAVLLRRPDWTFTGGCDRETINDYDGHVANFWRATKYDPDGVAVGADRMVNELDLHAVGDALFCRPSKTWSMEPTEWVQWIRDDESNYDAERAGQWAWFISNWIGGLPSVEAGSQHRNEDGVSRRRPHLGNAGQGVSRQLPHLGNAGQVGECERRRAVLVGWMRRLRDRLRNVRVCCGDWSRVCGKSVTWNNAIPCAVFLDPPYSDEANRSNRLYSEECGKVAHEVREWAIELGKRADMRIVLCGYEGEHAMPEDWETIAWKAQSGYSNLGRGNTRGVENATRERLWCSPACLKAERMLF